MRSKKTLLSGLAVALMASGCGGSEDNDVFDEAQPAGMGGATSTSGSATVGTASGTTGAATGNGGTGTSGATTTGTATPTDCTVSASAELSEAIQTVGIVTFTTSLENVDDAHIEFGLDQEYGMTAPVDLEEADYRTLLLGMKQGLEYHYRIVVSSGDQVCESEDFTLTTGLLMNGLPVIEVETLQPEKLAGGFMLTGQYVAMGGPNSPAYIIDSDGDYVWALAVGDYVTGVRMSYDGKHMWINGTESTVADGTSQANIFRVSLDGLEVEDLSDEFEQQDHSITVLPDESVIFYGHDMETQCANIRRRYPDGSIEAIVNSADAHGAPGACHVNHVEYSPGDDTLIFSDDYHDNYTKITQEGETVWVLGGETSDFTGDASSWDRQHGLDVLTDTRVLFFNNGPPGFNSSSRALEVELDLENMTATEVWSYEGGVNNQQLGDVQRLDNGNTMVAYSTQGEVHEVDPEGNLVQAMYWPLGGAFGYAIRRMSLYGPPPR